MTIEQQCTNLDLSKELKRLGVKQDSLYHWIKLQRLSDFNLVQGWVGEIDGELCWDAPTGQGMPFLDEGYSAFTVSELGEILRPCMKGPNIIEWKGRDVEIHMDACGEFERCYWAENEADARAVLLIDLIENGLLKLT